METKTIEELQRLSDEKLKQLALQRHKGGRKKINHNCFTSAVSALATSWETIPV